MDPENTQTRRRVLATVGAVGAAATIPAPAAASHDPGFFDGQSSERSRQVGAFVDGLLAGISQQMSGETSGAKTNALEARDEFNSNRDDWRTYINDRDLGGSDRQVLETEFAQDGETHTVYLVADWDSSNESYSSMEVVDSTDREVDERAQIEGMAAENAAEEIQTTHEKYISQNKDIDDEYVSRLAGKYYIGPNTHVTSTLLGDEL